jgi:hypothetical protein
MKYAVEIDSGGMTYIPRSWRLVQALKYLYGYYRNNFRGCNAGITDRWDLLSMPFRCGMTITPNFMKLDRGIQAIFMFCLRNLKDCNVGITDWRIYELCRWDGVSCHDIHTKFHKDWFSHSKVNRGKHIQTDTHTHTQHDDLISLFLFFENKESKLKRSRITKEI